MLVSVEAGRLVVHEHAAAVLLSAAAFRAPLAVLAVTGSARCGKSFLLNQLLGRADGFPTSAGVRGTHSTVKPTDASSNAEPLSSAEAYHAQKRAVQATLTARSSKAR